MLKSLHLSHFRSYDSLELTLSEPVFLILGPNATGKTNILEAMYVAATGRSFRGDDEELVSHHSEGFVIEARYDDEVIKVTFRAEPRKAKQIERNSVRIHRATLLGRHPVVLFEPNDLQLLSGPPERRRRYLDVVLSQTDENYRHNYLLFKRLLKQRNSLLWRNKRSPLAQLEDQLFILEAQMAPVAEAISTTRLGLIKDIEAILSDIVPRIAKKKHSLKIEFVEKSMDFLNLITAARSRDIALGTTTVGPHREDWFLWFDGHLMRSTASRGETRTALLGLKLAELQYVNQKSEGRKALLLLDDVFSELDESRRRQLIVELDDTQTVITSTDIDKRLQLPAQTINLTRPKQK